MYFLIDYGKISTNICVHEHQAKSRIFLEIIFFISLSLKISLIFNIDTMADDVPSATSYRKQYESLC